MKLNKQCTTSWQNWYISTNSSLGMQHMNGMFYVWWPVIIKDTFSWSFTATHFCLCPFPAPRKEIINVYFHLFIHFSFPTVFFRGGFLLFFPNRYLSLPFYFIIFFPVCTNPLFLYLLTLYHLFAILSSLSVSYYPTFPFFSMKNHLFLKNNNNKCRKKNIQLGMYLYICLQLNI